MEITDEPLERREKDGGLTAAAIALTSAVWGALTELLSGGRYSVLNGALMAVAFGVALTAWNLLWRQYRHRRATTAEPDRSNPLL